MIQASHLSKIYKGGWGTLTDLYQLTMAYGYWREQVHERRAVFHVSFRNHPFKGDFTIAAGLALVADYLQQFSFSAADVQYLGTLKGGDGRALFNETFLHYLQRLRFTGDVFAVPEGTLVFPHEPLLRIEAPLIQAQLIETALLNWVNFSSLVATKAARIRMAAGTDQVLEFGLRRAQGPDGGLTASRAAYIGGADASSNVWAGQYLGIPVRGTHAHSWVMVFQDELAAFERYAAALPNNCTFLVDTYDTLDGVKNAIAVGLNLRERGHRLVGVRLDSGDMAELSKRARRLLDEAGFADASIVASNDLDEYSLRTLKDQGATIDVWGVGTRLVTAYDQPALGGVYKLAAIADEHGQWQPRIKLSEQGVKTSLPGRQQVRRFVTQAGHPVGDIIYNIDEAPAAGTSAFAAFNQVGTTEMPPHDRSHDLLVPILANGVGVYAFPTLAQSRAHCLSELATWHERPEKSYIYGLDVSLSELKERLIQQHKS